MKRNLLIITVLCLSVLFLASALMPTFANAIDTKIYPGFMGVRDNDCDPMPTLSWTDIRNPSTSKWLRLNLPIVHDTFAEDNVQGGWVKVRDRHPSENISCELNCLYATCSGFSGWWSSDKYSSGSSNCPKTISFGRLGTNSSAHYFFYCRIPPKYNDNMSGIISYALSEYE